MYLVSLKKRHISILLTARFLLVVFSMNIIIGLACAIHIDRWFYPEHHRKMAHKGSHHHDQADHHNKSKGTKDNCCNDHVVKFTQLDKSFPQFFTGINAIFFTSFISPFYNIDVLHTSKSSANIRYFVRSHHPPIQDIRIGIQSFQI